MHSKWVLSSIQGAYVGAFGKDDRIQEICEDFGVEKCYKIAA